MCFLCTQSVLFGAHHVTRWALTGPDIMAFPTDDDLYILDCDAADDSIGCVLSQKQSNEEKVIAYGSQTLGKLERNYCATD